MVIDTRKGDIAQQTSVLGEPTFDSSWIQTQIEAVKSKNVSLAVIRELKLTENQDFMGTKPTLISTAVKFFTAPFLDVSNLTTEEREALKYKKALQIFDFIRAVNRMGVSYDIEVSAVSHDPKEAAAIANAVCEKYIDDQLQAKFEATRRTTQWLKDSINNLRDEASKAEQAVVEFKQKNNIVEAAGSPMTDQQLSEINTQLILASTARAEAKARLDRIQEITSTTIPDASIVDALKSEVIIKLRQQYLELASKEAILANKYGNDHLAAVGLRNQMAELKRNISDEMRKIAESYKSDYEIALAREQTLRKSLNGIVANSQFESEAQVKLRELRSNEISSRNMYSTFLKRYGEAVQQETFPTPGARIISLADPPLHQSQPNTILVLLVSTVGGFILAIGTAAVRDSLDQVFRTVEQVKERLQINCVTMVPALNSAAVGRDEYDEYKGVKASLVRHRNIDRRGMMFHAVEAPFSEYTESLRHLKEILDVNSVSQTNVIGFTSTIQNEGKSTTATNFAAMVAHAGARVLLVDADLRKSSLSKRLSPKATAGLIDVTTGRLDFDDAIWTDKSTGLAFLPTGPNYIDLLHPNAFLASTPTRVLIKKLSCDFDYVIVDLAPLSPIVDTRATANFIDSYFYIIEWGVTNIESVEYTLSNAKIISEKVLGVVLNKVDMKTLGRYQGYRY